MSRTWGTPRTVDPLTTTASRAAVAALAVTATVGFLLGAGLVLTGHPTPDPTIIRPAHITTPTVAPVGWS
jgi:hypothetical protein